MIKDKLYTISEVSHILGVHIDTIRMWDRQGKIKCVRVGDTGWRRFKESEIMRVIGGDNES